MCAFHAVSSKSDPGEGEDVPIGCAAAPPDKHALSFDVVMPGSSRVSIAPLPVNTFGQRMMRTIFRFPNSPHQDRTIMNPTTAVDTRYRTLRRAQQRLFHSGATLDAAWRQARLRALECMISENEAMLLDALARDLRKPPVEAYAAEIATTLAEIRTARKHLVRWMRPVGHHPPLFAHPARARHYPLPHGTVLIIGPWNYPLNLVLTPLVSALAAGNCCILKPSEYAPHTARLLATLCDRYFEPAAVACITGDARRTRRLIDTRPDFLFFTGGTATGRAILHRCARLLIPSVMELSGCNPAIIDRDIPITRCTRRIAWAKFFNAGQTCLAPNACFVHESLVDRFTAGMGETIRRFYGHDPRQSDDYARIVNHHHLARLEKLLRQGGGGIVWGGEIDTTDHYMAPTLVRLDDLSSRLVREEIFGPLLPIIPYGNLDEALDAVAHAPDPLVVYLYTRSQRVRERVRRHTRSGSLALNAAFEMVADPGLPFGGVGTSGIGRYHGRFGFEAFSYRRAELSKPLWPEGGLRYPPYRAPFALVKRALRFLM
jgi:acyl-CoA reductase-like NAD-dependent aldehyde dehydrogenase